MAPSINATRLWSSAHDAVRLATASATTLPIPNGTATANFSAPPTVDPARAAESNLAQILAIVTVVHLVALACVSLRIYTRVVVVKSPGMDDICMVLAAVCGIGGWAGFLIQAHHGLGRHIETVDKEDLVTFMHVSFSQAIVSATLALMFLKLSIGFNLLRLSTCKWYIWSLRTTMVLVVGYSIMAALTFFLHCKPMAGSWNFGLKPQCYSMKLFMTFGLVNTACNMTTDVLFATFPIFIIWPLNMRRKLRIYLICILSLGYFAVALGAVKAIYQTGFIKVFDRTFGFSVTFWGFLELNVGMIAACAVTLKPLLNRFIELGPTEHYHPYNGSAIPFLRRHRSLHINLHPHPSGIWNGPKHPDQVYELGHLRKSSKSSKTTTTTVPYHKHKKSYSSLQTKLGHSPASSKSSDSLSFYDKWDDSSTLGSLAPPPPLHGGGGTMTPPAIPPRSPLRVPVELVPSPLFSAATTQPQPPAEQRSAQASSPARASRASRASRVSMSWGWYTHHARVKSESASMSESGGGNNPGGNMNKGGMMRSSPSGRGHAAKFSLGAMRREVSLQLGGTWKQAPSGAASSAGAVTPGQGHDRQAGVQHGSSGNGNGSPPGRNGNGNGNGNDEQQDGIGSGKWI
ncbi:hypothetical protein QBC34DRAFT_383597 [Podospora aff. communis PSN243]|uniref:Rhodopsin domain-containing protein n=1 Tax=Podospora aff. communis PSN243 TaxID=3040156 RepID=A0AAV9GDJ3_9PEZI|nr:hypothetical protein QBC34DRAFT_383597 [Podospora aff. communis PSN243]